MKSDGNKTQTNDTTAASEFLTAEEVSARLRLPLSTVYYLAKTGELPAIQLGRSWRFRSWDLDRLTTHSASAQILVVDDDEVTRALVAGIVEARGHVLVEAGDAETGLAAARRQRFDLLLIDFKLPGMNGTELVQALAREYSMSQIVILTAFPDLLQVNKLFEFGALTVLRKPLDTAQFLECTSQILATPARSGKKLPRKNNV